MLSLAELRGITLYEPAEMVIAAKAGTTLAEIEATLAQRGQMLPFEPAGHRRLYGSTGEPSIGAVAACNISGPRRIMSGAARDHLIGVRLVNGLGEAVKSGGRVMKNVTGLDLVKLSAGAFGTLGVLTEVTFKVLPVPERVATLVAHGLDDAAAIALLSQALGSPFEVGGAAHLPGAEPRTLIRLEGFSASLDYRLGELRKLAGAEWSLLDDIASAFAWQDVRDAAPLVAPQGRAVWKISLAPSDGPKLAALLRSAEGFDHFYDWGGGLLWVALAPLADAQAALVRGALARFGGHATLMRAPDAMRASEPVFQPLSPGVMALTAGIKKSFDPDGVLNPGRMYAGI